jgi:hypothetical protein
MTKPGWKKPSNGNAMLSYWGLKAVVFPKKNNRYSYNILGVTEAPIWGATYSSEKEARLAAETAFMQHKQGQDWETPGRQVWEARIEAGLTEAPMPVVYKSNYARLDGHADHETAKAVHFDGCSYKDERCHSDRRGSCWSQGFWVPKSKLFFDEEERCWCIDRGWAEMHDIDVAEDEYEDQQGGNANGID